MALHETLRAERGSSRFLGDEPLRVICFATYLCEPSFRTEEHRDARNFLRALQGEAPDGASVIPVAGEPRILDASNANDALDWFGEMVAHYLDRSPLTPPFTLVPIPTSQVTLESSTGPWTALLAHAIVGAGVEAEVVDCLRWTQAMESGERMGCSASELYEGLGVLVKPDPTRPVILVDHLFGSSTTIRACARRLSDRGLRVTAAVTAGRKASRDVYGAFSTVVGELSPFAPGH